MYSVLIQNQRTIEYFNEAYPLFLSSINEQKIGCCRWNESGTTVETALPDIVALTDQKKEWRAIIVLTEHEESMKGFETAERNPYDFKINSRGPVSKDSKGDELIDYDDYICRENAVPLVRLTQMLGGVPAPEIPFKRLKIVTEKDVAYDNIDCKYLSPSDIKELAIKNSGRIPEVIYEPVEVPGNKEAYEELSKKYNFNGKRPTEIILITLRLKQTFTDRAETKAAWTERLETESSEFWQRNHYPSTCRFLVFDYTREGRVRKDAYLFEFWLTILLLATNDINPSSLQGYRLYNVGTVIDKDKMKIFLQSKIDQLLGTKHYLEAELDREVQRRIEYRNRRKREEFDLTMDTEGISLDANIPRHSDTRVDKREFGLCPETSTQDYNQWIGASRHAEEAVDKAYRSVERALDEKADAARYYSELRNESIKEADRFDIEDLESRLHLVYTEILEEQNEMPSTVRKTSEKLETLREEIRKMISPRIRKDVALQIYGILAAFVVLCMIPGLVYRIWEKSGSLWAYLGVAILLLAGLALIEFFVLLYQRYKFRSKIGQYNECLENDLSELILKEGDYEHYVNGVVYYTRGSRFLREYQRKNFVASSYYDHIQMHIKAINKMLDQLRHWSTAFYLENTMDIDSGVLEYLDPDILPRDCSLYNFKSEVMTEIPLNNTGVYVDSPLDFTDQLVIEREELFDNA